jgi:phosphodiesterase/alkaline phosphatase D-like protein
VFSLYELAIADRLTWCAQAYHEWMPTKKNVINDPDEEGQYWKYFRFHQLGVICLIIVIVIDWFGQPRRW